MTLAWLTDADHLLLLLTYLADRAARWYHLEDSHGMFGSYQELLAAFKHHFTPSEAESKSQKVKLHAL